MQRVTDVTHQEVVEFGEAVAAVGAVAVAEEDLEASVAAAPEVVAPPVAGKCYLQLQLFDNAAFRIKQCSIANHKNYSGSKCAVKCRRNCGSLTIFSPLTLSFVRTISSKISIT